ncbi:BppU family phage baseplate upper protein [Leuconostoc mesenteroides]|uniref:BppU family phage baseplate upper protein n=1 Tax=Leuconostoc mesenteroides TaxID=1245 RepID=UPI00248BA9CE|nr:BppU family phage baseplate upper protein [Leuconostoc mesenteroides]
MANNKYAIINTQLNQTNATLVEQLNGRQGDNGRIVYFSLRDGNLPHNISNQNISIIVKDAVGKIKILSTINNVISSVGGLFSMVIPGELYQASGDVQEAFMQISDDNNTVLSSIPITFTVVANNIIMTANASHDYIESVQKAIDQANDLIKGLTSNIEAQSAAYKSLQVSLQTITAAINSNQIAVKNANNTYSGSNTFNGAVVVNNSATFAQPISGRFQSKELPDKTDLLTLIEPGWHYIVRKASNTATMTNKPADLRYAFSVDTIDIAGYIANSWSTTMIKLIEHVTGNVYTSILSRDNMGTITVYSKWKKQGDGTSVATNISVNGSIIFLKRVGNLVSFTLHNYGELKNTRYATDYSTWADSGTIPPGYRPTALVRISAGRSGGKKDDGTAVTAREGDMAVDVDGSIFTRQFDMALPNDGSWIDVSGTYMTLDSYPS